MQNKKWNDQPYYAHEKTDVQKETGYVRPPHKDGLTQIQAQINIRSPLESPLKRWWLEQERLKAQQS